MLVNFVILHLHRLSRPRKPDAFIPCKAALHRKRADPHRMARMLSLRRVVSTTSPRLSTHPCRSGGRRPRFTCTPVAAMSCVHCSHPSWIPFRLSASPKSLSRRLDRLIPSIRGGLELFDLFNVEYIDRRFFTPVDLSMRNSLKALQRQLEPCPASRDSIASAIAVVIDGRG